MKGLEKVIDALSDAERNINLDYAEIAACDGIELSGYFCLDEDGRAEWVSFAG